MQEQQKIINFLTDFYNEIIVEPTNVLTSSLASMLVQITAGIAQNGIGKRNLEPQELKNVLNDWLNQVLKPAGITSAQGIAALLAQITAGVGNHIFYKNECI